MSRIVASILLAIFWSASAHAGLIDFTSVDDASVADTDGTVVANLSSNGGALTWTGFDGNGGANPCSNPTVLACGNDGVGIQNDEVTYATQVLTVDFSTSVDVTRVHLFDLFGVGDDGTDNAEIAVIRFLNGALEQALVTVIGTVDPGTFSGYAVLDQLVTNVTRIELFSNQTYSPTNTDFSLAAIETRSVPEPGTLGLLFLGLMGLGFARRMRTA